VTVLAANPSVSIFCRREQRPSENPDSAIDSGAFRRCEAAVRHADAMSVSTAGMGKWLPRFDACGTPGEINSALTLLAVRPVAGLGVAPTALTDNAGTDFRLSSEQIDAHFGDLRVETRASCSGDAPVAEASDLAVLLDDVEDHVTVVAHCAERCHLLDRLGSSFREIYTRIPIVVTCECAEEDHCPGPVFNSHARIAGMTVVSVPYDFGLSRGKSLLLKHTTTELVLVLDDDFVHAFHSCLECMVWRMRSRYHSLWRPFDIVGFPVLEDERLFGAFRGKLRVASHQLFLEPMIEQITPDGCIRVDICPMVFLGRTARLQTFKFQQDLSVGEHEQFFYSNQYFGLQVAVCFDSSYPHFRVNTMSPGYVKRRERMPALMKSAFEKLGFQRAMFLFKKYTISDSTDYDELLEKNVPPWYISDDTCGARPSPPVPFSQVFVVILSSGDEAGESYRKILRGHADTPGSWLQRLMWLGPENFRMVFATSVQEYPRVPESIMREQETHRDLLFLSQSADPSASSSGLSAEQLLRLFSLLRDFQFRWLVVIQQDVFVHSERMLSTLQVNEPSQGKVLGSWRETTTTAWLEPQFFAFSRDIFALLSSPPVNSRLGASGVDASFGDLQNLGGGLNNWLRALAVQRIALQNMHLGRQDGPGGGARDGCPVGTLALHPVSPDQLQTLSRSAAC